MRSIVSPVISMDRVAKNFRSKRALDHVSATIHPGQFVAIIGRSGAGKTTLLRCLARAITVGSGAIHFGDVDLATLAGRALREHRAQVGMIYQQFNLVRRLRVFDNVLVGRLPHLTGWRRWAAVARWFSPAEPTSFASALPAGCPSCKRSGGRRGGWCEQTTTFHISVIIW